MLASLRYFGHVFNPIALYYCFDAGRRAGRGGVADVNNIPWGERHPYVLARGARGGRVLSDELDKELHVSPLMGMDQTYSFRATEPGSELVVHIESRPRGRGKAFDATLSLRRRELTRARMAALLARYPAMSMQVVARIYAPDAAPEAEGRPLLPPPGEAAPEGVHLPVRPRLSAVRDALARATVTAVLERITEGRIEVRRGRTHPPLRAGRRGAARRRPRPRPRRLGGGAARQRRPRRGLRRRSLGAPTTWSR